MFGDKIRQVDSALAVIDGRSARAEATVSVEYAPIYNGDNFLNRKDLRLINKVMEIRYDPYNTKFKNMRYVIISPIFSKRGKMRAFNEKDLLRYAERGDKEVQFMLDNTNVLGLFDLCRKNPNVAFQISFDLVKYNKRFLKENGISPNLDIPFYRSLDDYEVKHCNKEYVERLGYKV